MITIVPYAGVSGACAHSRGTRRCMDYPLIMWVIHTVGADLSCTSPPCISHKRRIAETWRNAFQVPIYRPNWTLSFVCYIPMLQDTPQPPYQHLLPLRIVEQRWCVGQINTLRQRHSVASRLELSRLERPGPVVYITSIHAVMLHHSVEAVALGEPVLKSTA